MKPTEITMQIVKNLGNYETCRLEASFTLDPTDNVQESFLQARRELEKAYTKCYGLKPKLTTKSKEFDRVCKALAEKKTDIEDLLKYFDIQDDAMAYFKEKKLLCTGTDY